MKMTNTRNTLAIALATAALGLGALSMSTPADAREMGFNSDRGFEHHIHCDVWGASCNHGGYYRGHGYGWGRPYGYGYGYGWGHPYGYGYSYYYPHYRVYSPVVVETP